MKYVRELINDLAFVKDGTGAVQTAARILEMVADAATDLDEKYWDETIKTALLSEIVVEQIANLTDRMDIVAQTYVDGVTRAD